MKIFNKLKIDWQAKFIELLGPVLIVIVGLFLASKNFVLGTWLTGWDNLHAEFDLVLNIKRALYAVWQEYQGLGLLSGMAHASDLPRLLVLFIASAFIKTQYLRYFWTFLMLILGPLGTYFLISKGMLTVKNKYLGILAGVVGGLFYLNNLATVQYFYTPYESFVTFYGFLPWLLYVSLGFLNKGDKKALLWVVVVSILATAAFYVQTMFLVFVMCLGAFILESVLTHKLIGLKRSLVLIATLVAVNSFWLMPSIYFSFGQSGIVKESKINSFSTPEIELFNEATGNIGDIASLKGFWFEYTDVNLDGGYDYLMPAWRDHVDTGPTRFYTYVLFGLAFLGVVIALGVKDVKYRLSGILMFALSYFMLANTNVPFGGLYKLLTDNIGFLGVAFRSVFTKWSVPAALAYSVGLGFSVYFSGAFLKSWKTFVSLIPAVLVIYLSFFVVLPAYRGELILKYLRIQIPQKYFNLFDFMDKQPEDGRVAFFPMQTFWGWNFYDWQYRGSGFLWYGIKQPILDRAFDVWSAKDENFYHEASNALYSGDKENFLAVMTKYDVSYILLDESVDFYGVDEKFLRYSELKDMLLGKGEVVFNEDGLSVYKLADGKFVKGLDANGMDSVGDSVRRDTVYLTGGNYFGASDIAYPLAYLYQDSEVAVDYQEGEGGVWVGFQVPKKAAAMATKLTLPSLGIGEEVVFPAKLSLVGRELRMEFKSLLKVNGLNTQTALPGLALNTPLELGQTKVAINGAIYDLNQGEEKEVAIKLVVGAPIAINVFDVTRKHDFVLEEVFLDKVVNKCWNREGVEGVMSVAKNQEGYLSIETKDAAGCFAFKIGKLESINYALFDINLPYRSHNGSKPHFCVIAEGPEYKCLNDDIFYNVLPSDDWTTVRRQLVLDSSKIYWMDIAAKPPDFAGEGWTIDYKEPVNSAYPLAAFYTFDTSLWDGLLQEQIIDMAESQDLKLEVFALGELADFTKGGRVDLNNCDVFKRGEVDRVINDNNVIYSAEDRAANCDFISLNTLSTNNSYLVRFMGEGLVGRGLKFYLYNKATERNDMEFLLGPGIFDKTYALLDWDSVDANSYVLNVENRSFGSLAEDRLDKVVVYQAPISWIQGIGLENAAGRTLSATEVGEYKKTGTYKYVARVTANTTESLIVLSQATDRGWVAYNGGMFGKKLEKVSVNGWANGWLIPASDEDNRQIVIVYLPQYLEFIGFGILFGYLFLFGSYPILMKLKASNLQLRKLFAN